ncbi:MAG: hypothetical protein JSS50_02125 [Proteobacteria bacterium]|nr:hypothetical protein [Pseudomonadota bacterium]
MVQQAVKGSAGVAENLFQTTVGVGHTMTFFIQFIRTPSELHHFPTAIT